MKTKTVIEFTVLTLGITLLTWGGMIVLEHFGLTFENHAWLGIPLMLGGLSPTYVSYIVLKKNGEVSGFKEWLKNVFYVKAKVSHYLVAILLVVLFVGVNTWISGSAMEEMPPFYMFFVGIAMSFVAGGLEEAGWRYILQPELDKRYGFVVSSLVTGVIWFVWHIPLLIIGFLEFNMGMYAIGVLGMTFFYGAIIRISGKSDVFLSVFAHTLTNVALSGFPFNPTWSGTLATFLVMVVVSSIIILLHKRQKSLSM